MRLTRYISFAAFLLFGASLYAADVAVLQNGFSIRHERREVCGDVTRLYLQANSDAGYVDVPTSEITQIEPAPAELAPASTSESSSHSIQESITAASQRAGIDRDLIESVVRNESSFNPRATSSKGARGLMQLMPKTAEQLGVTDAFDPAANVDGGSRYLRGLLVQYNSDLAKALAAYNAGPQRVAQYNGIPPYRETYAYVSRVIRDYNQKKLAERKLQHAPHSHSTIKAANIESSEHTGAE